MPTKYVDVQGYATYFYYTGKTTITISADGKTFREIDQGKDEKGRKYKNHLVFERP